MVILIQIRYMEKCNKTDYIHMQNSGFFITDVSTLNNFNVSRLHYAHKEYKVSLWEDCFYLEGDRLMQLEEENGFAMQIAKYFYFNLHRFFSSPTIYIKHWLLSINCLYTKSNYIKSQKHIIFIMFLQCLV